MYSTEVNGETTEFGTSGMLYRSNKLMYDRATETLWHQFRGEPVVGPLQGLINDAESLEEIRDRLAEALEDMDTAALADRLAEGMFAARLAGDGGAQIRDDSGEDQA